MTKKRSENLAETLPEELVKQLSKKRLNGLPELLVTLFEANENKEQVLDLDDLLIGLWQQTRKVYHRGSVSQAAKKLKKEGRLLSVARGTYRFAA
jgi:hypothetical protein